MGRAGRRGGSSRVLELEREKKTKGGCLSYLRVSTKRNEGGEGGARERERERRLRENDASRQTSFLVFCASFFESSATTYGDGVATLQLVAGELSSDFFNLSLKAWPGLLSQVGYRLFVFSARCFCFPPEQS